MTIWGGCGSFPKLGVPFGGPHNKDYSIFLVYIGVPQFWELPCQGSIQGLHGGLPVL